MKTFVLSTLAFVLFSVGAVTQVWADAPKPADNGDLIDLKKDSSSSMLSNDNGGTATIDSQAGALKLAIPAGKGYPGVKISSPDGPWDLTGYNGVDAEITNTGTDSLKVTLRVDGDDDWKNQTWDCQIATIPPGTTQTIHVTFGMSYGQPGYKMPLDHVLRVLIFALDPETAGSLNVTTLRATKAN